jgi:hypothetical protein
MRKLVPGELCGAKVADARHLKRMRRMGLGLAAQPEKGLPQIFRDASQLEGAYRLLSNERVKPSGILEGHVEQTRGRARQAGRVVVAHDTTEFSFGGERAQLGRLSGKARGFLGHFALAIDASNGMPLGVVHCEAVQRADEKRAKDDEESKESLRWHRGAAAVAQSLPGSIQVMDREADSYSLLEQMRLQEQDFVVRLSYRKRLTEEGPVGALLKSTPLVIKREVQLSARKKERAPKKVRRFPARKARLATLAIGAERNVELLRPHNTDGSPRLIVNVVRVFEPDPPADTEPVEWLLYTSLPVDTPEQILAVADAYRLRWVVEEYFKALKTGCAFEKRQLESLHALLNLLALFVPIAWSMLHLRTLARVAPDASASSLASDAQLACLRFELGPRALPKVPTVRDLLFAIARLGGHLRNNGDPGWLTIGRGYQDLLMLERGYLAGRGM